jgi:hypothetical protein
MSDLRVVDFESTASDRMISPFLQWSVLVEFACILVNRGSGNRPNKD